MSNDAFADARARLLALRARFDAGTLAPSDYEIERRAAERALGDAVVASAPVGAGERPSGRLLAGLCVLVLAVGATACVVSYRLMMRIGRLPTERRILS